jgi:hypothetical protein
MMNFNYDGNKYKFCRVENEYGHKVDTLCLMESTNGLETVGESRLHPNDANKFNKALGKIIAFSHCLQNLDFNRQYRLNAMAEFKKVLYQ